MVTNNASNTKLVLQRMTMQDFALLGAQDLAYVKEVKVNGEEGWAIFGANGSQIGMAPSRDLAFAAVRQNDLEPMSVH